MDFHTLSKQMLCGLALIGFSSCASPKLINSIKPLPSLNMYHMNIINTYTADKSIHGMFCATADFTKIDNKKNQPPIILYIVDNTKKMTYFGTIMGGTGLIDDYQTAFQIDKKSITKFPIYQQQCGKNKPFSEIYQFQFSFNALQGDKSTFFSQRQQVYAQLKQNGYLDIMAVRVPFMTLFKPIFISQQPTRLYFTPEQIKIVTAQDVSNEPEPTVLTLPN